MPVWLQIAGAIASAILSYYGRYDDSRVKEMIADVAKNVNFALLRLNEISLQIGQLISIVERLPDEFRDIEYESELRELNDKISATSLRLKTLLETPGGTPLFKRQIEDTYNELVRARTNLNVKSLQGNIKYAALAGMMSPIAQLLELGLLYHLGREARPLLLATQKAYHEWLSFLLDQGQPNSVAKSVEVLSVQLASSDHEIASQTFSAAINNPDVPQAIYCLEHRIGSTDKVPGMISGGRDVTWAEFLNETWIRFYAVVTASRVSFGGEMIWDIEKLANTFRKEQYAKGAASGAWYGAGSGWSIPVDFYDSRDIQGYRGQNTAERAADILRSQKWGAFITATLPNHTRQLSANNKTKVELRFARDVLLAIQSASILANHIEAGRVETFAVDT